MITDVYISFSSEAEWSSVLDNTRVRGCFAVWKVRCELPRRDATFFSGIEVAEAS